MELIAATLNLHLTGDRNDQGVQPQQKPSHVLKVLMRMCSAGLAVASVSTLFSAGGVQLWFQVIIN